jgi:hypothetical protein
LVSGSSTNLPRSLGTEPQWGREYQQLEFIAKKQIPKCIVLGGYSPLLLERMGEAIVFLYIKYFIK